MQNISSHPFLTKLNVLHMNGKIKTNRSTNSQKQAQITTERNNTMLCKKKAGADKNYVQNIVKRTRHGKQLIKRKILHIKRNIGYF